MFPQSYPYGVNPYTEQQSRIDAMRQYQNQCYPQMPGQPSMMQGRLVASIEEAKVAQVPVDGSCIYFPCPAERKIFVKSMDLNGNAVFETYTLVKNTEAKPCYAEASALEALTNRVMELEAKLKGAGENV